MPKRKDIHEAIARVKRASSDQLDELLWDLLESAYPSIRCQRN